MSEEHSNAIRDVLEKEYDKNRRVTASMQKEVLFLQESIPPKKEFSVISLRPIGKMAKSFHINSNFNVSSNEEV